VWRPGSAFAAGKLLGQDESDWPALVLRRRRALRNEPITLGSGTQTRSFCYVDDLLEGLLRLMNSDDGFTGPMNLGNLGEFSMIELAEKVKALTGSRLELIHKQLPTDDPKQRLPDIHLAREQLDWEPNVTLEEGLKVV
jgi:UDP-glucuronate decarboxylase